MIRLFRLVGLVEGLTTVALFLVAMPLKYVFGQPQFVPHVGAIHGIAFIAYIVAMVFILPGRGFTPGEWARTTVASFFPFGTFLNDPFLRRKQLAAERA